MFETILIAYDGSPSSSSALRCAADLARRYEARLHLLGIVHTSSLPVLGNPAESNDWGMEKDHIHQAMNIASIELGKLGLDPVIEMSVGDPVEEIIACAKRIEAGLVVMGHVQRGTLARWFDGSVGAEMLNHLPCDLLITKREI